MSTEHNSSITDDQISLTLESCNEKEIEKNARNCEKKQDETSSLEDDDDTIAAHVIIEQALHLPLMKTATNER